MQGIQIDNSKGESGRGLPHSKTLRDGVGAGSPAGLGVRQPSGAFGSRFSATQPRTLSGVGANSATLRWLAAAVQDADARLKTFR